MSRVPTVLSVLIAVLAATASLGGLLIDDLYRDNVFVTAAWRGSDLVTFFVAVPLLVGSMILSRRGSRRAQVIWLSMLAYTLYGYAFFVFGAAFNRFFLIYVALFALSLYALIFALIGTDPAAIARTFLIRTPVRSISAWLMFTAVGLGLAWIAMSLAFVFTGKVPQPIVASGHPTGIVFALDLALLLPCFVLASIWLWQRRPLGYVLATMMSVKGATYTLSLTLGAAFAARAEVQGAAAELTVWGAFTVLGLIASGLLLGNMRAEAP